MLLDDMQQASTVLDEARSRHREEGIFPHYTTLYVVSGLHFLGVKKKSLVRITAVGRRVSSAFYSAKKTCNNFQKNSLDTKF